MTQRVIDNLSRASLQSLVEYWSEEAIRLKQDLDAMRRQRNNARILAAGFIIGPWLAFIFQVVTP